MTQTEKQALVERELKEAVRLITEFNKERDNSDDEVVFKYKYTNNKLGFVIEIDISDKL